MTSFTTIEKRKDKGITYESIRTTLFEHYTSFTCSSNHMIPHCQRNKPVWHSKDTKHFNWHVYPSSHQNFASSNPLTKNTWFNLLIKYLRTTTHTSATAQNFKIRISFTFLVLLDPLDKIGGKTHNLRLTKNHQRDTTTFPTSSKPECLRASLDTSMIQTSKTTRQLPLCL